MMRLQELPNDILHLIAGELADRQDLSSLHRCALSGSQFARAGAVSYLYQLYNLSPVVGGETESSPENWLVERDTIFRKWAILWRSIILSTYDQTILPYSQYLRLLDLRNLVHLLDDGRFRGQVADWFFAGQLAHLRVSLHPTTYTTRAGNIRQRDRLDMRAIVLAVADRVTKRANKIENIAEPAGQSLDILAQGLASWVPQLQSLRSIQFGDGAALASETLQDQLVHACPLLDKVEIYQWQNDAESDRLLARFLHTLRENSLTHFVNRSDCGIGELAMTAFKKHSQSMSILHLAIGQVGIAGLSLLRGMTNLVALAVENLLGHSKADTIDSLSTRQQSDLGAFFAGLTLIQKLLIKDFKATPYMLHSCLAAGDKPMLQEIDIFGTLRNPNLFPMQESWSTVMLLAQHSRLESLTFVAEAEGCTTFQLSNLCDALGKLGRLKKLYLGKSSEYFTDVHLMRLAGASALEQLTVEGYYSTDEALLRLLQLNELKQLSLAGITGFSFAAYDAFVGNLGWGNRGFLLDVAQPIWEDSLTAGEQESVKQTLQKQVDGTFLYQVRDPADAYQYGSESDDSD